MSEPVHMGAQNGLPQTARTAVYQKLQALGVEMFGQQFGYVNGIHCLQFGKMVAAANGAERSAVCGLEQQFAYARVPTVVQRRVNAAQLFGQFGIFGFVRRQVGLPERHAAADVVADKCGIEMRHAEKCRANRIAAPCVQIGHAGRAADVRQFCGGFQLLDGVAFNPSV